MQEVNFSRYHEFVEALDLQISNPNLGVFVLDLSKMPPHIAPQLNFYRNDFYEITIATNQTNFEFAVDGTLYSPQNTPFICFFAPSQLQSYRVLNGRAKVEGCAIYFSKLIYQSLVKSNSIVPFFKREYESYHQLTNEEYKIFEPWCQLLIQEFSKSDTQNDNVHHHLLGIIILKAKTILTEMKSAFASRPEEIVSYFLSLIDDQQEHQGVQFYADQMALTPKQLNTFTKKVLNKTALKVIQSTTIEKAKALILQSNLSTTEIAYQLGFNELSNFSRLFKRITTFSPNEFRLQSQK